MYRFDESRGRKMAQYHVGPMLPPVFASVPADVAIGNSYAVRGLSTGKILNHRSALSLAVGLDLERNRQLLDMVVFDDLLAEGGPSWAEHMADRLDPEHVPDVLVRMNLAGRIVDQAVSLTQATGGDGPADRDAVLHVRDAYRERGIVWSLVGEPNVCPTRASTLLWLSACIEMGVPTETIDAIEHEIVSAESDLALSAMVMQAARRVGVDLPVAVAAFGRLIVDRKVRVDLDAGAILTTLPLAVPSRCYGRLSDEEHVPTHLSVHEIGADRQSGGTGVQDGIDHAIVVADAWRSAFARDRFTRFQS